MGEYISVVLCLWLELVSYGLIFKLLFGIRYTKKVWKYFLAGAIIPLSFFLLGKTWNYYDASHFIDLLEVFLIPTLLKENKNVMSFFLAPIVQNAEGEMYETVIIIASICKGNKAGAMLRDFYPPVSAICLMIILVIYLIVSANDKDGWIEHSISKKQYLLLMGATAASFLIMGAATLLTEQGSGDIFYTNCLVLGIQISSMTLLAMALWYGVVERGRREAEHNARMAERLLCEQKKQTDILVANEKVMRIFRHDIRHHLYGLKALAEQTENTGILRYCESFLKDAETVGKDIYTGNIAIDAVLNYYFCAAGERNITMERDIFFAEGSKIDEYDVCTVIANLLENAIEACDMVAGVRYIRFAMYPMDDLMIIECENTVSNMAKKVIEPGRTSKENRRDHGFGLMSIERVVKKYHGRTKFEIRESKAYAYVVI